MVKKYFLFFFLCSALVLTAQNMQEDTKNHAPTFSLHPNPVYDGIVHIKTGEIGPKTVFIYDLFGKLVMQQKILNDPLRVDDLQSGVYVVQIIFDGKAIAKKLVVK